MAETIDAPELTYSLGKRKLTAKFTNAGIYLSCADIQKIIGCRLSDLVYYARMQDLVILPTSNDFSCKTYWISKDGFDRVIALMPHAKDHRRIGKWIELTVIPSLKRDFDEIKQEQIKADQLENKSLEFYWKNFFKGIIFFLLILIAVLVVSMIF